MAEKRKLISKIELLTQELNDAKKRLHEIDLLEKTSHPYYKFAEKFERELGFRPCVTKREITSKNQQERIRLMEYLIEHGHTLENPISYKSLINTLGLKSLGNLLYSHCSYSPLYGGLKVKEEKHLNRSFIIELYIEDIKKAKIYLGLLKELISLPTNL